MWPAGERRSDAEDITCSHCSPCMATWCCTCPALKPAGAAIDQPLICQTLSPSSLLAGSLFIKLSSGHLLSYWPCVHASLSPSLSLCGVCACQSLHVYQCLCAGGGGGGKRTLFYKDCSLGSVKTQLVLAKLLMNKKN